MAYREFLRVAALKGEYFAGGDDTAASTKTGLDTIGEIMTDALLKHRKIQISELPDKLPDFNSNFEPKDSIIKKWITDWILSAVKANKIKENDILPSKSEISDYLGVSTGTVQNAIRYVEDEGYLKSKQKLGTMISNISNPISNTVKLTSKREKAVIAIKRTIVMNKYKIGKPVPSIRKMAEYIGISQNTTRLAYECLCREEILESLQMRGNDSNWYLKKIPELSGNELKYTDFFEADTIVDKLTEKLKTYLASNFQIGDKIPSHETISKQMNVSIKTINDCVKRLNRQGIIITRRGKYGSILAQNPLLPSFEPLKENSIFAKAEDAIFYSYQKTEAQLTDYINKNYNTNDKLPSMIELSGLFGVSTNTIRKALISLEQKGYITFARGRFGGTFIVQKPENAINNQYQWLSINPEFI